jgi:hypothetical protein
MTAGRVGVAACAIGVVLFFAGLYGAAGQWSLYVSAVGALVLLLGVIALFIAARARPYSWPHPAVIVVSLLAIALYAYVHPFTDMLAGWWLWASIPYVFCIVVSCSSATRLPAVAGAVVALVFDAYTHYIVAISKSSTAAIAYVYSPLWNTLVFAPTAILIAWLVLRRRRSDVHDAP